jgi:ATP-binding cassette subfamily C protein CydC
MGSTEGRSIFKIDALFSLKLARVLLRETPIVILDEPFEFLDSQMVERIAQRVLQTLSGKVVIVVSHLSLPIAVKAITL